MFEVYIVPIFSMMRVGWTLLLLYACRGAAEVPECLGFDYHWEHGCTNNFNSDLNDAFQLRIAGDTARLVKSPRLRTAYCTKKNYALLSEHCGACRYTLTITEPKQYADTPICITPPVLNSLVPGAMMDLGHPMNGKEVNIVRTLKQPFNQWDRASYGCSADDWPARSELEGQIALTMYPLRGGCRMTTSWPHAGDKGAGVFISVLDLIHWYFESLPPPIRRTPTGSAKNSPGFLMMGHPYIMDVLALPANATVRGRVDFANCGKTSEERMWQNEDLSPAYLTNCMHFMGPFKTDLCEGIADELCTRCDVHLYKSRASYERNETGSCLHGEDLLPYRSRMFFQANYKLPSEVVVLIGGTQPRCKEADWRGLRGKTMMYSPNHKGMPCTRLTQLEAASKAGVRGLVIRSHRMLFGRLTDIMNVSASYLWDTGELWPYALNASHHDGVDLASGLPFIRMYLGPSVAKVPPPPPVTDANPLPTVEKDTGTLLDESGALAAVVLIPILAILIAVKVVHGVQYSRNVIGSIQGVPVSLGSTALTLSCVVLLCIATYAMTESAGSDATNSAFQNNKVNMAYSNTRNSENVRRLTRDVMLELSRSFRHVLRLQERDAHAAAAGYFANGPYYSINAYRPYATWGEVVQGAAEAWTSKRLLDPEYVVGLNHWWKPALFSSNGYYWDSVGLRTNPTQRAREGSIWSDPARRDDLVNNLPGRTGYIDPATVANMTVAETDNGFLYDLVTDSKMCEMSFSRYTAAQQFDPIARACLSFTARVHVDGLAVPRTGSFDPLKWAGTSHLPQAPPGQAPYKDLADLYDRMRWGPIYSKYQMQHTTLPDGTFQDEEYAKAFLTYLVPADRAVHLNFGLITVTSMPSERLQRMALTAVKGLSDAPALLANTTILFALRDSNVIFLSNHPRTQIVDMVKNHVEGRDGVRIGTKSFDLSDSNHIPTNAVGAYLAAELYKTNATFKRGTEYVFEMDQLDHYHAVSSVLMYFSFDSNDGDNSDENWDTQTLRLTPAVDAAGDVTYESNAATPVLTAGRHGSAMQFDGFAMVAIYPYLTVRVPRVWAARSFAGAATDVAEATAYRGVPAWDTVYPFNHYRKAETFDGLEGVVVCERDFVSGETGAPYLRDRFEFNQAFSVSMYVRPEAGTGVFGTSRGAQRLFSDATGFALEGTFALYADGVMQVGFGALRVGCRTQAVGGAVPEGEWTFLVATVNRETRVCSVFANGRHIASGNMSELYESKKVNAQNYTIGEGFVGAVDEVRVHRLALDEHDATHLYQTYTQHAHDAVRDGRNITVPDVSVRSRKWTVTYDSYSIHQVIMTPTEDILRETDAITRATSALVQEQEDKTAKTKTRKNDEAVLVVTILALLVMLLFLILNDFVIRPFTQFAHAIQGVAYMRNVSQISDGSSSLVMEVRVMSRAMNILVGNMKEYKTYMPLSMLGQVQSDGDSDGDVDTASGSTQRAESRRGSSSERSGSSCDGEALIQRLRAGLQKKKASFAVCNLSNFNTAASARPITETVAAHADYVTRVVVAAECLRGVPEQFCGDRIYVFFNGAKVCNSHTTHALSFGDKVRAGWNQAERVHECKVNIAVTTGYVRAGNIGSATMRRYSCVGWPVSWCFLLERYGRASDVDLIADHCLYEVAQTRFIMRHHSFVVAGSKNRCVMVTRVMGAIDTAGTEWMYELEKAKEQNPHNAWNRVLEAAYEKDLNVYATLICELSVEEAEAASHLVSMGRESFELVTRRPCCGSAVVEQPCG